MWQYVKSFKNSGRQTKYFILFTIIYMVAMIWTTAQAYARLYYSRSDMQKPIVIQEPPQTQ